MITSDGIDLIEGFIKGIIAYAEVHVDDTWHKAADTEVTVNTGEDKVTILATVPSAVAAGSTIDKVRIKATNGKVFCEKETTIRRSSNSTGVLYSCEIFITASEIVDG